MATVWRATHQTLNQPIALKFIEVVGMDISGMRDRFLREARVAAAIRHRNVVDILDFGTSDEGQPFMAMELLEGESLADRMNRSPPMTVAETVRVMARVLSGLGAVHDAGIQHRDLKPENIFLAKDADGAFPKLIDFGISRALDASAGVESVLPTRENALAGTPQYMSPEQARGLQGVDQRSDLWSAGVILYELLTGRLPYDGDAPGDVMIKVATEEPPDFATLRPDLAGPIEAVVRRAMHREPERRFQDARTMRAALLTAATHTASNLSGGESVGRREATTAVNPSELYDAVGSAYEPGDSGLIEVDADVMSLMDSILPSHGIEAEGPPPAAAGDDPFAAADRGELRTEAKLTARRAWWPAAVVALGALVASAVGVGLWALTSSRGDSIVATEIDEPTSPPGQPTPTAPIEPAEPATPAEPALVRVELTDVPGSATVEVDGEEWTAEGPITLARDGRSHTLVVRAADGRTWSVQHEGTDDGAYAVELPARATPAPRRRRARRRAARPGTEAGDLIRSPGF